MRKWVDYEQVARLYDEGKDDLEIAQEIGCTKSVVAKWRLTHGLPCAKSPEQRAAERVKKHSYLEVHFDEAIAFYNTGADDRAISKRFNCSTSAVRNWRDRHDLKSNSEHTWKKEDINRRWTDKVERRKRGSGLTSMQRIEEISRRAKEMHITYGEYVQKFGGMV